MIIKNILCSGCNNGNYEIVDLISSTKKKKRLYKINVKLVSLNENLKDKVYVEETPGYVIEGEEKKCAS